MTNWYRALAALIVSTLVGCAGFKPAAPTASSSGASAPTTPVAAASAPAARPAAAAASASATTLVPTVTIKVGKFPTSTAKPTGKVWDVMHKGGFTGSSEEGAKLLGLTPEQVKLLLKKRDDGTCVVMKVPNGTVLDALTFTRDEKHLVQKGGVLVRLKDAPSRATEVCDLGGGTVAMRFHGCGNWALVRGWKEPLLVKEEVMPPTVASPASVTPTTPRVEEFQGCTKGKFLTVNIWDNAAAKVKSTDNKNTVAAMVAEATGDPTGMFKSHRVSRFFWKRFLELEQAGSLERANKVHPVEVFIAKKDGTTISVLTGEVIDGHLKVPMPAQFMEGDVLRVVFQKGHDLISPVPNGNGIHVAFEEYKKVGCGFTFHVAAIER